jgi:N-acetylmuramoyl-L-alanine amidase
MRNTPPPPSIRKVYLNPGHGYLGDPGALYVGHVRIHEADLNLAFCPKVAHYLRSYRLTAHIGPRLRCDRVAADAHAGGVDLLLSIHHNWALAASARGVEVFHNRLPRAQAVCAYLYDTYAAKFAETGFSAPEYPPPPLRRRPGEEGKFAVLRAARALGLPAVLLEVAFISNADDRALLATPRFVEDMACLTAQAIAGHLIPS